MINNEYKYLVWSGTAAALALCLFLLVTLYNNTNSASTNNIVSFSGEGKVSAVPDVSVVDFSIVTQSAASKTAQNDNSAKSNKVTDFLKKQGIADKDVKTTGYNVYPQYNYPKPCPLGASNGTAVYPCGDGTQTISGYQVNQSFEVKVRDLTKVGAILDGLVTQGANQVNNLGFQIDNPEKIKDEARAKAIADAKSKADSLRGQLGINLGKIVNYTEGGNYPIYFDAKTVGMGGGMGGGPAPSIPTGENEITVNVTITYQIR